MPTVQGLAARLNRQVAGGLERAFAAMPADKQTWKVLDEGRSALHQVAECAEVNRLGARILREKAFGPVEWEAYQAARASLDTPEKALAALRETTAELVAEIESFPNENLDDAVTFPWDDTTSSLAEAMWMPYWNMAYHIGQINFIQTLYGDREMR